MRHFFMLGAVGVLTVACGGTSSIGDGINGVNGRDGGSGTGGKSAAGGAGTGTGGAGTGKGGAGTGTGGTGTGTGGASGGQCTSTANCPQPGAPCQVCADGTTACPSVDCVGGKCVGSFPTCSVGAKCTSAGACAVPQICKVCSDGSASCATGGCVNGQCVTTFPACPGGGQCKMDSDCPVPPVACQPCPDGSCAPASTACVGGQCSTTIQACAGGGTPKWFATCGPPVCQANPPPSGLPPCTTTEKVGAPCTTAGMQCDTGGGCAGPLQCATTDPRHGGACPISRAKYKQDIQYLSQDERAKLASDVQSIPLVRYRYKDGPEREHLGFIIEDIEPSPSVDSRHDEVDLYGYTSMAVAALQQQHAEIEVLKRQVQSLEAALGRRAHGSK